MPAIREPELGFPVLITGHHMWQLVFLIKWIVMIPVSKARIQFIVWQNAKNKLFSFLCAKRSDEPQKA